MKACTRRSFMKSLAGSAALCTTAGCSDFFRSKNKPNVLFIFADDQAFNTINALGYHDVKTPNLDRLVRKGVTFTHAYNQGAWHGAVCVASRTMLNTGRFLWESQKIEPDLDKELQAGRFWSQYMQQSGYETYMSGKWHVHEIDPNNIFDHVKGLRPGGMPKQTDEGYNRPIKGKEDPWKPWDKERGGYWEGGQHWSEALGDYSLEFIDHAKNRNNPFFMYLAFNAPHDPRQSPKEYVDMYPLDKVKVPESFLPEYPYNEDIGCGRDLRDERLAPFPRTPYSVKVHKQEYYAIITHLDAQVGRILDALEESGMADNTYIFFTADHGLAIGSHGLMGKQNMFDNSVRVPLMVAGPGIPKNEKIDAPVYLQDIMPTALEIANCPKADHIKFNSLLPLIKKQKKQQYEYIYGGYKNLQRMITDSEYKLIYYPKIDKTILYNLKKDPQELKNLADDPAYAGKIAELKAKLAKLEKEYADPILAEK